MKIILLLLLEAVLTISCLKELDTEWINWKITNKRNYADGEEVFRRAIWEDNMVKIQTHNAIGDTFTLKINKFGDMTHYEFMSVYLGRTPILASGEKTTIYNAGITLNDTVDWRQKGYVTKIKDQGQCGSCWAFSATGSLEGQYFKKTGKLVSFSEQELVDCSKNEGNAGCKGGDMDAAFDYIKQKGIESESDYPYRAHNEKCKLDTSKVVTMLLSHVDIKSGSIVDMKQAVGTMGPISAAMDASDDKFQFYDGGIYHSRKCKNKDDDLDHGVLAIGYGTTPKDYWLMKNSWGTDWGMDGFFKIAQAKNECGICTSSSYPVL